MSEITFTPAQEAAIRTQGAPVLVSAAAGSGKTRVLVERLMAYITDAENPRNITDFLVITFTRAAAAELRSRILREISIHLAAAPTNSHLRRQQMLCHRAQIGTIHSFCSTILRESAHVLNITPDFTVIDSETSSELEQRAMRRILDAAYARIGSDEGFRLLADTVGAGRDDGRLESVILELHRKTQSHAYPRKWLKEQSQALDISKDVTDTVWGADIIRHAAQLADYWITRIGTLLYELEDNPGAKQILDCYGGSLNETLSALRKLCDSASLGWDGVRSCFPIPFPRLLTLRKSPDPELSNYIKSSRETCKKAMQKLEDEFFASSFELLADFVTMRPAAKSLLTLASEFDDEYSAEKLRLGYMDFPDLEHYALLLLTGTGKGIQSETAKTLRNRYAEIMVDEYQDVSRVQDMIFSAVAGQGNLFMVGDVKQSIYRFRLADPGIFIEKYNSFHSLSDTGDNLPRRIPLQDNFRSRAQILLAVNHVFRNIMSPELGEIKYDADAELYAAASYPDDGGYPVVMSIINAPETSADEESADKTALEALHVANQICGLISGGATVRHDETSRPLEYSDIVVLLRSPANSAPTYRRVFSESGIPVFSEQGGGFFDAPEVSASVSMLSVIDNPRQDIPLLSVLRSPMFAFSPDELASMRAVNLKSDLFTALDESAQYNEKFKNFLTILNSFRLRAPDTSIDAMLWDIYTETGLLARISAQDGGEARRLNLMSLYELARQFCESGYRGIHSFINYLERMRENGNEPAVGKPDSGNAVRIMSIHKSKGLEYPVVFLAGTAGLFNKQDSRSTVLIHPQLGLGMKLTDMERGIEYPTLPRYAIARRIVRETLSEEMRILYVAMTRARERLYISCVWKNPERVISKLRETAGPPLSPRVLESAQSPAHWLAQTALLPGSQIELRVLQSDTESNAVHTIAADNAAPGTSVINCDEAEIKRRLSYSYPYASITELPSKLTATELKDRVIDPELREDAGELDTGQHAPIKPDFRRPDFISAETGLTGAERGTAAHLVMQHINFSEALTLEGVKSEISRLAGESLITRQQADAVDPRVILSFVNSDIGQRLLGSSQAYREFRFSMLCDAGDFYPGATGEEVLLQGVVDCCFAEGGKLVIVDFKTDYVTDATISSRVDAYTPQLRAYASAMSRIFGMPVKESVIYFLRISKPVVLK